MTRDEFRAWRQAMGFNKAEAARRLGIHANSMTNYDAGRAAIPLTVALACAALAAGLQPWRPERRLPIIDTDEPKA